MGLIPSELADDATFPAAFSTLDCLGTFGRCPTKSGAFLADQSPDKNARGWIRSTAGTRRNTPIIGALKWARHPAWFDREKLGDRGRGSKLQPAGLRDQFAANRPYD